MLDSFCTLYMYYYYTIHYNCSILHVFKSATWRDVQVYMVLYLHYIYMHVWNHAYLVRLPPLHALYIFINSFNTSLAVSMWRSAGQLSHLFQHTKWLKCQFFKIDVSGGRSFLAREPLIILQYIWISAPREKAISRNTKIYNIFVHRQTGELSVHMSQSSH